MGLRFKLLALALGIALGGAACSRQIGDDCSTGADCDPNGRRVCDLSQPGGYCTILGCDETSCPSEASCIRFFPVDFLTKPCVPDCEDRPCAAGITNDCAVDELCIDPGLCAPLSTERRMCVKACGSNGDCRGGYECRLANTRGTVPLSATVGVTARFCAPYVPQ